MAKNAMSIMENTDWWYSVILKKASSEHNLNLSGALIK
jgi:hypothetical protein